MDCRYTECLEIARQELRLAGSVLRKEISNYPTPIAGCDVQFNHLLVQSERVRNALEALDGELFVPTPRQTEPGRGIESR